MPTPRSAAVKRGFAARARESASLIVRVCECDGPINQGLTRNTAAHAIRVTLLTNMERYLTNQIERMCAPKMCSGQMFRWRRIEPGMIFQEERWRRKHQYGGRRRRLGDEHRRREQERHARVAMI